jgi:pyrimidine-nucleoside phosphorylase/thymidine phosphorylase
MSRKIAAGVDALILDVKVGSGGFIKRRAARGAGAVDGGNRLALDKKVQALIADMNQPLGFAIGNARNHGSVADAPKSGSRISPGFPRLAARMISGKVTATLEGS